MIIKNKFHLIKYFYIALTFSIVVFTISFSGCSGCDGGGSKKSWIHEAYLKAPNNTNKDNFGNSVALDGDTLAVGAYFEDSTTTSIINGADLSSTNDDGNNNGAVYVFKRIGTEWIHEAYLKAPNNTNNDRFGYTVALDGDTIAVGVHLEDSTTTSIINGADLSSTNDDGAFNGAVYVFKRSGTDWIHEAYLKAPNNTNEDWFGESIALDGDTLAVGARLEDSTTTSIINGADLSSTNDDGSSNGAVYVFKRAGTEWIHEAYLKSPNNSNDDEFGNSVALDGDTLVVGAFFEDSTTTSIINGADLSSTNDDGSNNGAAYVFKRTGTEWIHEAYLKAPNNSIGDIFGISIALDGDTIAVGALFEASTTTSIINGADLSSTNDDGSGNGAVYVYKRSGTDWVHEAYLKAPNNSNSDQFGGPVALDGDTLVVGAFFEDSTTTSIINGADLSCTNDDGWDNGAVYVFKRAGTEWVHEAYLKAPNNSILDWFGGPVALNGNTIAVGARFEDSTTRSIINGSDLSSTNDDGFNNGAVYVFKFK